MDDFMQWAMNTLDQQQYHAASAAAAPPVYGGAGSSSGGSSAGAAFPSLQALRESTAAGGGVRDLRVQVDHYQPSSWSTSSGDSPGAAMDHDAPLQSGLPRRLVCLPCITPCRRELAPRPPSSSARERARCRPLLRPHDPAAACFAPLSSATIGVPRRREPLPRPSDCPDLPRPLVPCLCIAPLPIFCIAMKLLLLLFFVL